MFRGTLLGVVFVAAFVFASSAYAGKVELTTYYPAPYGEYKEIKTTTTLKAPVAASGVKTAANTKAGEIWVEGT